MAKALYLQLLPRFLTEARRRSYNYWNTGDLTDHRWAIEELADQLYPKLHHPTKSELVLEVYSEFQDDVHYVERFDMCKLGNHISFVER